MLACPRGLIRQPAASATIRTGERSEPRSGGCCAAPVVFDFASAIVRCGFTNVFLGARRITASLDRYTILRWFNRITRNSRPPQGPIYSSAALDSCAAPVPTVPGDEMPSVLEREAPDFREDVVAQNQLTVITVVRPGQSIASAR